MSVVERRDGSGRSRFHARVHKGKNAYSYGPTRDTRAEAAQDERDLRKKVERQKAHRKRRRDATTPRDHWLYRAIDANGALLYVGITCEGVKRLRAHGNTSEWWRQVSRLEIEHFPNEQAAVKAELAAILDEKPRYNRRDRRVEAKPSNVAAMYQRCRRCGSHYRPEDGCCTQREARRLRAEGLTYGQVAERLSISVSTARTYVRGKA